MAHLFHRPSKKSSKPSFVSYVGDENGQKSSASKSANRLRPDQQVPGQVPSGLADGGSQAKIRPMSTMKNDDDRLSVNSILSTSSMLVIPDDDFRSLEPAYLPGESPVARADRVFRWIPYSDCKQGIMGSLFVTNFRVTFIPIKRNSREFNPDSVRFLWKNKLYSEDDILLNNIDAAYQVSKGRRKKIVVGKQPDRLKKVEIHCKDLRVHQFSLENCRREDALRVAVAIAKFGFPDKVNLQFAFAFKGDTIPDPTSSVPDYTRAQDWEKVIGRLKVKSFKVTDCNSQFINSQFMPKYFVIPTPVTSDKVTNAFKCFEDNRYPVWSYTHTNGASLIRMTFPMASYIQSQDVENSYLETLRQIHPEQKKPFVYDVHEPFPLVTTFLEQNDGLRLPSLKDIRTSYEKLRDNCMSVTVKELESSDSSWLSAVDSSKWLSHVSSCLKVVDRLVQMLTGDSYDLDKKYRRVTVVIKEHDGARDLCPLLTTLIQIYVDPYARTQEGFQTLIEREWVALGHRFRDRYGITGSQEQDDRQCPVFLLFLDCVHQLIRQLPKAFQFSDTFLLTIWDSLCSGLFGNFLFNDQHEMLKERTFGDGGGASDVGDRFSMLVNKKVTTDLLNVWDWAKQYSAKDRQLLLNPLYTPPQPVQEPAESREPVRRIRVLAQYYKEKPSDCFIDLDLEEDPPPPQSPVLFPEVSLHFLELWAEYFLRWTTPVQVVGGGSSVEYLLHTIIQEEIHRLEEQISVLGKNDSQNGDNPAGISGSRSPCLTPRLLEQVTSSFPYSPSRPTAQVSFFGATLKMSPEELTSSSELESSLSSAGADYEMS